jgi:hypothetical protein
VLYGRSFRARFSERMGIPLYRAHLPEDKVTSMLEHISEGCELLQTAQLVTFWSYLQDRGRARGEIPRLAALIRQNAEGMATRRVVAAPSATAGGGEVGRPPGR